MENSQIISRASLFRFKNSKIILESVSAKNDSETGRAFSMKVSQWNKYFGQA